MLDVPVPAPIRSHICMGDRMIKRPQISNRELQKNAVMLQSDDCRSKDRRKKMIIIALLTVLTVFVVIQQKIDDGRISGRSPLTEGREFQSGLDFIQRDYL